MGKPKIYVFPVHASPKGDCQYIAVAQDGDELAGHISSSEDWGKVDMGIMDPTGYKHKFYREKYPDGYELEYVPDWKAHPFLSAQANANKNAGVGQTELDSQ